MWHGGNRLARIAPTDQVHRALIRRRTFWLQQLGFLLVSKHPETEISPVAARASRWLSEEETR
ncbi:hypothetical protein D9V34_14275 [Mycetocola lacteus]|uniref:DUF559 domain-containing protein n=1 Tax=Mycetocola lacteus TaxID=76637 RepID=A0A3L7AKY7_9MICO|nr:hypothetical protein D9V34_14275 [Mycetocola lacteus]